MKHVLVTGGTRGIGLACVGKFLAEGVRVTALWSRDEAAAKRAEERFPKAEFLRADVAKEEDVQRIFGHLTPDVLVNNAGISLFGQVQDTSLFEWEQVMAVNAGGTFLCCKYAVKKFLAQGKGAIVNISSVWGETGGSCESAYSASKGAVIAFTKALAKELAPSDITVNCVCPGVIDTAMNARFSAEEKRALEEEIPLGRFGSAEEVAEAVFFLAQNRYMTGQVLGVNGGLHI